MRIRGCIVTVILICANMLVFAAELALGAIEDTKGLLEMGASFGPLIANGEFYRHFTSMFLHFDAAHLGNNMIGLWAIGSFLEQRVGSIRFAVIYVAGGLAGNIMSYAWEMVSGRYVVSVGASGGVFALFGCILFLFIFKRNAVREMSLFRLLMALGFLFIGNFEANVNIPAHMGGFAGGFITSGLLTVAKTYD